MVVYILVTVLFLTGLWAVLAKRNLARKIIGLNLSNTAIIILFVYSGARGAETAPILIDTPGVIADPLPQALMLTAIVIGVGITALALGLIYRLYLKYGTLNVRRIAEAMRESDE